MATEVKLVDNSQIVIKQMDGNVEAALQAMGVKGVNLVLYQMRQGYGKPIRQTGDLQRDLQYETNASLSGSGGYVRIGNTLNYATFVHEGTSKMRGRPYITDGLSGDNHAKQLQQVAEEALKNGFNE